MKIFLASGGYLSIDIQCKKALEDMGHEVIIYNYRPNKISKIPLNIVRKHYGRALLKSVFEYKPDFFFMIKGETIPKGIVKQFSSRGIVTANWTLDEPLGELYSFNKIHNIEEYDYFFVFDPSYIEKLKKINPNSFYLPCSADPINMHVEAIPMAKRDYPYNVSFVGSYQPEREVMVEKISEFGPHIFGFNWKNENNKIKNLQKFL